MITESKSRTTDGHAQSCPSLDQPSQVERPFRPSPLLLTNAAAVHVFVYLELLSEGATARDLGLVDRATGLPATVHATAEPRVFRYGDPSMYFPQAAFMGRAELEASPYLADDRLTIRCAVTVVKEPQVVSPSAAGQIASASRRMLGGCCRQTKRMPLSMRSCVLRLLGDEEEEGEDERAIIGDMQKPEAGLARVMPADADHQKMVPRLK